MILLFKLIFSDSVEYRNWVTEDDSEKKWQRKVREQWHSDGEEEENKYQIGRGDIDNRTIKDVRTLLFTEQLVE